MGGSFQALSRMRSRGETMQTPEEAAAMLRLKALGWGIRHIWEELGCSHMTVRRYVAAGDYVPYLGRGQNKKWKQRRAETAYTKLLTFPWAPAASAATASSPIWKPPTAAKLRSPAPNRQAGWPRLRWCRRRPRRARSLARYRVAAKTRPCSTASGSSGATSRAPSRPPNLLRSRPPRQRHPPRRTILNSERNRDLLGRQRLSA